MPSMLCRVMGGSSNMNLSDPQVEKLVQRLSKFALVKIAERRMTNAANQGRILKIAENSNFS